MQTGKYSIFSIAGIFLAISATAVGANKAEQKYIAQLVNGGPSTIRSTAENIYHTNVDNREVLDVAAEVLHQQSQKKSGDRSHNDMLAWLCRALGQSVDGRYQAIVEQVADSSGHKSVKKHCGRAADDLPSAEGDSYQAGAVSLAQYQEAPEPATPQSANLSETGRESLASGEHPFTLVREGMSMEEVHDLVGYPTNTSSRVTGKQFNPFYYGGDTARMVGLYKGLGRIEYTRKGKFSQTWRVMDTEQDAEESGYP